MFTFIQFTEMTLSVLVSSAPVEVRKEGLEMQINRLAELIGRLENKVALLFLLP